MSKIVTIVLVVFLSIVAVAMAFGLYFLVKSDFNFDNVNFNISTVSNKLVEEKEVTILKTLNIKTDVTDITVEEKDTNSIKIELYSENPKNYEITENENDIKVVLEEGKKIGFNFFKKSPRVKIYVPKEYNKNMVINSDAGDVKIGNLPYATLDAKLDVGDLRIKELKTINTTLRVGDLRIEKVQKLIADVKTGDIKVNYVNELISKIKTGDIKIDTLDGQMDIVSTTGDIKVQDATIKENSKIKNNIGDIKINNISGCYIDAKTRVGDINVNQKERKSDIELKIENNVGDVRVH